MPDRLTLDAIRACLEGAIPGVVATCAADGTPNVAYLSQVEYIDAGHLALSFQFFNKTRRNILANPQVQLLVIHPLDGAIYRIDARYLRTETDGALFERMKAKLAGIASHTGMSGVFKLLGSDVYAVDAIEQVRAPEALAPVGGPHRLSVLRRCTERLGACADFESLLETTLDMLQAELGIGHAMLLILDAEGERLYTVASRGYGESGAGSEVPLGEGVIGVAARMRTPIRINHMTLETAYSRAIRERLHASGSAATLEREIALPGLEQPHSQLALPIACGDALLGALFVESTQDMRFSWDDEDALVTIAAHLGVLLRNLQFAVEGAEAEPAKAPAAGSVPSRANAAPLKVRYFEADASIFLDDDYLIKGVAGSILWKLLREHAREGRTEFSNRELRLSPEIGLPEIGDNLEARLALLARRLVDRKACVRIEKTGRGRFHLRVERALLLQGVAS
ncbi:MAG: GAF domain-containing protein [Rhizobacter sp.]|nr:GAF domain-containing protein [Rhizobacter sp.]